MKEVGRVAAILKFSQYAFLINFIIIVWYQQTSDQSSLETHDKVFNSFF
jgi:hypothetical protein